MSAVPTVQHAVRTDHASGFSEQAKTLVDVTVLLPCLNERDAIAGCVQEALRGIALAGVTGEVLVVDNGSTDGSPELARKAGARVVFETAKGYGNAYLRGFEEASGKYIIIGDSDGTYDFTLVPKFLELLRAGYDFVNGSRIKGEISEGAMPFLHRYLGVPFLSWFLNRLSHARLSDAHCGMRGFTRDAIQKMGLCMPGMEFASEIIMQAARSNLRVGELPIPYRSRQGSSKLRTFSDGWRHLRFMLLYSPTQLFLGPGLMALCLGLLMMIVLLPGRLELLGAAFDIHYMVVASLLALLGFQILNLGLYARMLAASRGILRDDRLFMWAERNFSLERGLAVGASVSGAGLALLVWVVFVWVSRDFSFGTDFFLRPALLGLTLVTMGTQTIFGAFFLSLLRMKFDRRPSERLLRLVDNLVVATAQER